MIRAGFPYGSPALFLCQEIPKEFSGKEISAGQKDSA